MDATVKEDHFQSHQWMSPLSLCFSRSAPVTSGILRMNSDRTEQPLNIKCHGVYVCTLTLSMPSFMTCIPFVLPFSNDFTLFCFFFFSFTSVHKSIALCRKRGSGTRGGSNKMLHTFSMVSSFTMLFPVQGFDWHPSRCAAFELRHMIGHHSSFWSAVKPHDT